MRFGLVNRSQLSGSHYLQKRPRRLQFAFGMRREGNSMMSSMLTTERARWIRCFVQIRFSAVGGLPLVLLPMERARQVVETVEEALCTPMGLRSLARGEPGYVPRYEGDVWHRDSAYHQGTVWPWLIGPFVEAWVRVRGNTPEAKKLARQQFLEPLRCPHGSSWAWPCVGNCGCRPASHTAWLPVPSLVLGRAVASRSTRFAVAGSAGVSAIRGFQTRNLDQKCARG